MEGERGVRVRREFAALAAVVVGEEAEATGVEAAEQDDAGRGPAVGSGGGERHRLGFGDAGRDGGVVPRRELENRVAGHRRLVQRGLLVFLAGVCGPRFHVSDSFRRS